MSKLSYTKRVYIFSGIAAAALVGLLVFIVYPLYQRIITLDEELYNSRVQLAIYQQERTNLEKTQQDYSKIKNDITNISKIFVEREKILDFISALETIAANHSVTQNIDLDAPPTQTDANESIPVSVSIDGSWQNVLAYLADLESLDYYLVISNLTINQAGGTVRANLSATTFGQ